MAATRPVRFGVNYLPGPASETLRWAKIAEEAGFDIVGIADSQSVYRDVYMCLALCAAGTRRVRLGPRVINPLTRHPAVVAGAAATLAEMAPGRTMLGIGTGDSAVLNLGLTPSSRARLRAYVAAVRELLETGRSVWEGPPRPHDVGQRPGSGLPRRLRPPDAPARGRDRGRGNHQHRAHPGHRPGLDRPRASRRGGGRTASRGRGPLVAPGRQRARRPGGGHRRGRDDPRVGRKPPQPVHDGGQAHSGRAARCGGRARGPLPAEEHSKPDSSNRGLIRELGLLDYLADRFAIAGTVDECTAKIEAAVAAGARQFWMSIHFDDKERFLRDWKAVMEAFR